MYNSCLWEQSLGLNPKPQTHTETAHYTFLCLFWMSFLVRNCFREKSRGLISWRMRSSAQNGRPSWGHVEEGPAYDISGPSSYANSIFCSLLARFYSFFCLYCLFLNFLLFSRRNEAILRTTYSISVFEVVVWMHFSFSSLVVWKLEPIWLVFLKKYKWLCFQMICIYLF